MADGIPDSRRANGQQRERVRTRPAGGAASLPAPTASGLVYVEIAAITSLVLANLFMVSGLLSATLEKDIAILGGFQIAIILGYSVVSVVRGHAVPLVIAVALAIYLVFQTFLFREISGAPININATLTTFTLLLFIPLYETRLPLGTILRIVTITAVSYIVLYVALNGVIIDLVKNQPRLVLETDGERDRRVFLAFSWALYVLFLGLFSFKARPIVGGLLMAVAAAAIVLANSRLAMTLTLPVLLAAIVGIFAPGSRRVAAWIFAAAFVMISLIIMWGYADPNWNAYSYIARDASGTARFFEFQDAVKAIKGHELFGVGIAPSGEDLDYFIRPTRPFFVVDLGTAGMFFQFGLFGVILFMAWSVLCIAAFPNDGPSQTPTTLALHYAVVHAGFTGFFAPNLMGSVGVLFGALVTSLWLKGGFYSLRRFSVYLPGIDPNDVSLAGNAR